MVFLFLERNDKGFLFIYDMGWERDAGKIATPLDLGANQTSYKIY